MTARLACPPAPGPLEPFAAAFDRLFGTLAQRRSFREYLQGLLRPRERNKTLTALVGPEPVVGAQAAPVQRLQWFLSESAWDVAAVNARRLAWVFSTPALRPHAEGVLVLDDTGDRKAGTQTAHVARQYLGSVGKIDNGIVAVTTLWADERVYYPLHLQPYTPASRLPRGKADPAFRTKPQVAEALVDAAVAAGVPFRAIVADCFYGDHEGFVEALDRADRPYVLALKPQKGMWAPAAAAHTPVEAAQGLRWDGPEAPGDWTRVVRRFRDGHEEVWWAAEATLGPWGPDSRHRPVVATTDPATLPALTTWYLLTNLPRPGSPRTAASPLAPAELAEVVRLYSLRLWVEQGYKQVKSELGWADFQVRADAAIQRHWHLVCCAFTFCWWAWFQAEARGEALPPHGAPALTPASQAPAVPVTAGRGENPRRSGGRRPRAIRPGVVADDGTTRPGLAGPLAPAQALLARLVLPAPTGRTPSIARRGRRRPAALSLPPRITN
ncbi:MAG TPA: IS701 family transposase [Tepidisphaeraceae bacterium]|nr:IS701 family transposase [Tepidisphaeraceae bacterium]